VHHEGAVVYANSPCFEIDAPFYFIYKLDLLELTNFVAFYFSVEVLLGELRICVLLNQAFVLFFLFLSVGHENKIFPKLLCETCKCFFDELSWIVFAVELSIFNL
jgi:hypothetical protein